MATLVEILRDAVQTELAAAEFYKSMREGAVGREARRFLKEMSDEERAHAAELEHAARNSGWVLPEKCAQNVELVETRPEWTYVEGMNIDQALQVALEAEQYAALYYDALADQSSGPVKSLLDALARREEKHIRKVKDARKLFRRASVPA